MPICIPTSMPTPPPSCHLHTCLPTPIHALPHSVTHVCTPQARMHTSSTHAHLKHACTPQARMHTSSTHAHLKHARMSTTHACSSVQLPPHPTSHALPLPHTHHPHLTPTTP